MSTLHDSLDALAQDDSGRGAQRYTPAPGTGGRPDLATLVEAARRGEPRAWQVLVQRFTPLVRAITSRYPLGEHDAEDVAQVIWLRLVEHLHRLREPLALPGWIATTARHESLRLARAHGRTLPVDPLDGSAHEFAGGDTEIDADRCRPRRSRPCGRVSPTCRRRSATCCSCSRPTLPSATGRSARGWGCRSAASARPGLAPWPAWRRRRRCAGT